MSDWKRPSEIIEYGAQDAYADIQNMFMYIVVAMNDSGTIKASGTHHICKLVTMVVTAIPRVIGPAAVNYNTNTLEEYVLQKFGRLLRIKKDSETWLDIAKGFDTYMAVGAAMNTFRDALKWMIHAAGGPLLEHFGEWNKTTHKPEDDAIAAIFAILNYVVFWYDLHLITWSDLLYSTADWPTKTIGDAKSFSRTKEETWSTLLFSENNTSSQNVFGIESTLIDDQTLRGLKFPWVENAHAFAERMFSESKWIWRRHRFVQVKPVFSIYNPGTVSSDNSSNRTKLNDNDYSMQPYSVKTNVDWKWLFSNVKEAIEEVQSKYFQNRVFGTLKSRFTFKTLYEIGAEGLKKDGEGGILWHQVSWVSHSAIGADDINTKFGLETEVITDGSEHYGLDVLTKRRDTSHNKKVIKLGKVSLETFKLAVATSANRVLPDADFSEASTVILANMKWLKPIMGIGFAIQKSEDEPYKINNAIIEVTDPGATKGDTDGKPVDIPLWVADAAEGAQDFAADTKHTKKNFYKLRAKDPYKKLDHEAVDFNEFDVQDVRGVLLKSLYGVVPEAESKSSSSDPAGSSFSQKEQKEIESVSVVTSATAEKSKAEIHKEKVKEAKEKKEEQMKKEKEKKAKEQPVSALPESREVTDEEKAFTEDDNATKPPMGAS